MNSIELLCYFAALVLSVSILVYSLRKSSFGVLIASHMMWPIMGLIVYPLCYIAGFNFGGDGEAVDFIRINGRPGLLSAVHILLGFFGMFLGYFGYSYFRPIFYVIVRSIINFRFVDSFAIVRFSLCISFFAYILYFSLVGVESALINAAAARGGDMDGFGEGQKYLFLKTVAALGFFGTAFVPMLIDQKKYGMLSLYVIVSACAFINSISRNLILYGLFVPIVVYVFYGYKNFGKIQRFFTWVFIVLLVILAGVVLFFGKVVGHLIGAYVSGESYSVGFDPSLRESIGFLLNNFGFMWASVQAGINNFFLIDGPLFPVQYVLAGVFGYIPVRIFDYFDIGFAHYSNYSVSLACVNSSWFGYDDCTVPPLMFGYSAYFFPLVGSFVFSYFLATAYALLEEVWCFFEFSDFKLTWIPYFCFSVVVNVLTFIPNALMLSIGQIMLLLVVVYLIKIKWSI
jgi:hypothetical protein